MYQSCSCCRAKYEDTILKIKQLVETKLGVPVEKQLLFWHDKELTASYDHKTLLDLHLHTGFSLKGYDMVGQHAHLDLKPSPPPFPKSQQLA